VTPSCQSRPSCSAARAVAEKGFLAFRSHSAAIFNRSYWEVFNEKADGCSIL
jgi:hypothetical protein